MGESDTAVQTGELNVEIVATNAPVTEGETLFVNASVQNLKGQTIAQTVVAGLADPSHADDPISTAADTARVVLEPDETGDVTLELAAEEYRGGNEAKYEKKIWVGLADRTDSTTVTVRKPPRFEVEVNSTNSPIVEGETLEVEATVENTGGEEGTYVGSLDGFGLASESNRSARKGRNPQTGKEIKLPAKKVTKFKPGAELSEKVKSLDATGSTLKPGETETHVLTWETDQGDAGNHAVAVQSRSVGRGDLDGDGDLDAFVANISQGPMRTGQFAVEIDGAEVGGWQRVTIPGRSVEQDSYRESDRVLWGQTTFDDLEMERGVQPGATELHDWIKDVQAGKADAGRKEIAVKLRDEEGQTRLQWTFQDAWIKSYDPPELDASADGDMATESATVAFDRMKREEL